MINAYTTLQMTTHRLMHALIWLADSIKPLHSAGARNFGYGYIVYTVSQLSPWHLLPDRLLPDRGATAEVQIMGLV